MNEFLLAVRFFHPSLVSSLKLPLLSYSRSPSPSLSERIPLYLSEQGESERCRGKKEKEKKRNQEKESRRNIRRTFEEHKPGRGVFETFPGRTQGEGLSRSQGSKLCCFSDPCWTVLQLSETSGYFWSVSVGAVWDGCHHAARKIGGTAAVPTSENRQAEGKNNGFLRDK